MISDIRHWVFGFKRTKALCIRGVRWKKVREASEKEDRESQNPQVVNSDQRTGCSKGGNEGKGKNRCAKGALNGVEEFFPTESKIDKTSTATRKQKGDMLN